MKRSGKIIVLLTVLLLTLSFAAAVWAEEIPLAATSMTGSWSTDRTEHGDIADFAYHIWIHRTNDYNKERSISFQVTEDGTAKVNWRLMQGGSATHLGQYTVTVKLNGSEVAHYEFLTDANVTGDKTYTESLGAVKKGDVIEYTVKEVAMGDWDYMYGRNSRPCGVEAILTKADVPKTGDASHPLLWALFAAASLGGIAVLRRKKADAR